MMTATTHRCTFVFLKEGNKGLNSEIRIDRVSVVMIPSPSRTEDPQDSFMQCDSAHQHKHTSLPDIPLVTIVLRQSRQL